MTTATSRTRGRTSIGEGARHPPPLAERVRIAPFEWAFFLLGICVFTTPPVVSGRALPIWAGITVGRIPVMVVLAGLLALVGWTRMVNTLSWGRYLVWSVLLVGWVVASAVAAWDALAFYRARSFAIWALLIVPGLASLLRERRYRRALTGGFVSIAVVFAVAALGRMALGRSPFDNTGSPWETVLLVNRNQVNVLMVVAAPLLLSANAPAPIAKWRRPLLVIIAAWVIFSGGRSGLVALVVIAVVFGLAQPASPRRLRVTIALLSVFATAVIVLPAVGGYAIDSAQRLIRTLAGERDTSDAQRELIARRAWNLTMESPAFGVGFGTFAGTYDEVVDEGETEHDRRVALRLRAHNAYLGMSAESGILALFFFLAVLVSAVRRAWSYRRRSTEAVALVCMFAGVMSMLLFDYMLDSVLLFLPLALLLGTVGELDLAGTDPEQVEPDSGHRGAQALPAS